MYEYRKANKTNDEKIPESTAQPIKVSVFMLASKVQLRPANHKPHITPPSLDRQLKPTNHKHPWSGAERAAAKHQLDAHPLCGGTERREKC